MDRRLLLAFDLGGVLIENAGREKLMAMLPAGTDATDVRLRWLACPIVQAFERGRIAADEFADRLLPTWGISMEKDDFLASFAHWPMGFYRGAGELLEALRPHYRLACLSNSNAIHWARFPEIGALFDEAYSSHLTGEVKPDPAAFACVLEGRHPGDVHFFDDLQPNVDAAVRLGLKAHRVDGLDGLERALRREGLFPLDGALRAGHETVTMPS